MASIITSPTNHNSDIESGKNYTTPLIFLTTLFFMWGFLTCLNDILIPHLKAIFDMEYTQTMLIQFTFFGAYALMSIPASFIIGKIGYQKGIVLGLSTAGLGAFLFYPASLALNYLLFLFAFFTLATGITILQVAANPYVAILGKPETASSRLTLTQAFNSLGTTIAPLLGALLILGGTFYTFSGSDKITEHPTKVQINTIADSKWQEFQGKDVVVENEILSYGTDKSNHIWFQYSNGLMKFDGHELETIDHNEGQLTKQTKGILLNEGETASTQIIQNSEFANFQKEKAKTVQMPYIGLGLILLLIALIFLFVKLPVIKNARPDAQTHGSAWQHRHLSLGAIGIFVYVGAEVSIGSFLVNFFGERNIAGLSEVQAAKFVALYWCGAMIGRFQGAIAMAKFESKLKQLLLGVAILIAGFFLAWYISGQIKQAVIFTLFVFVNFTASLLGRNKPNRTLAIYALAALILVATTIFSHGCFALWTIVAVGLFNSIMFPTIFTLAIDQLGHHTSQGSGILNTAIVGGAIIPMAMGALADSMGIQQAFFITLICYGYILFYALKGYKPIVRSENEEVGIEK